MHSSEQFDTLVGAGCKIAFTAVPRGSEVRIGVDRDSDGYHDGFEIVNGTDPADPDDPPGSWRASGAGRISNPRSFVTFGL